MPQTKRIDVYKEWLGIPEGPRPPDHYSLLRLVKFEDDVEKIQKHYTKLNAHVRKYATGQYSLESQELLNELARAMLCLTDPERKREYDESLGRTFEKKPGLLDRKPLGEWLVDEGHVTAEQLAEAESFAEARGLYLRDAVVQMKLVDIETATRGLAHELGRTFIDLAELTPDDSVLDRVPRSLVKRHQFVPLFLDGDVLLVACAYEPTPELEEEMRLRYEVPMRAVLATPLAVNQAIAKYYAPGMRDEALAEEAGAKSAAKKSAKAAAAKSQPKPKKRAAAPLSAGELAQRKQLGWIIMCWGVILPILLEEFILKPYVYPDWLAWEWIPSVLTLVAAPVVIGWVLLVYWKQ